MKDADSPARSVWDPAESHGRQSSLGLVAGEELPQDANRAQGQSAEFVCAMEDVLEVYQRPYDGNEVLVCMDETSKQQVKETRVPRPAAPGLSAAYDYEYERNGVSSLMLFAPLDGFRERARRPHVIKKLVDEDTLTETGSCWYNLNTHKLSSLYEAFSLLRRA